MSDSMSIDPATNIGSVHLTVSDLQQSRRFYEERIGLRTLQHAGGIATMGAGNRALLMLYGSPSAPRPHRTSGLYHFAIVVPSRSDLSRALRNLVQTRTMMTGFADHGVSEAIYLSDPDGIGIEIYRDRPRSEWPMRDGALQMGSEPLDVENLLAEAAASSGWEGLVEGTRMGHVHFHVGDLDAAERFYRDEVGLDLVMRYGRSASFLSAGGYHHHVAINTWAGLGAPAPPAGAIGLRHVVVHVPNHTGPDTTMTDPSGNTLILTADPARGESDV